MNPETEPPERGPSERLWQKTRQLAGPPPARNACNACAARIAVLVTIGAYLQRSCAQPTPDVPEFDKQCTERRGQSHPRGPGPYWLPSQTRFFPAPTEGRVPTGMATESQTTPIRPKRTRLVWMNRPTVTCCNGVVVGTLNGYTNIKRISARVPPMHRRGLKGLLAAYRGRWPQESATVARFDAFVDSHPDCFHRSYRAGRITGSAWLVDIAGDRVLLAHHRKLRRWLQPGGHSDGDPRWRTSRTRLHGELRILRGRASPARRGRDRGGRGRAASANRKQGNEEVEGPFGA